MQAGGALTLKDGAEIAIRRVDGSDRDALVAGFERLSPTSRFQRFFTGVPYLSESMVARLTDVDQDRHVALGVFDPTRPSDVEGSSDGLGIGVGRYFVANDDPASADAALAVIDEYQGRGIGTLLLQALVITARQNGIETFTADVMTQNRGMTAVLSRLGARPVPELSDPHQLRFEIAVPETAEPLESTAGYRVMRELARRP